jgi:uncharacterized protein YdhG (YjbR/CyaY superfamily)
MATKKKVNEVDAYLAKLAPDARGALQRLRKVIKSVAPGATEQISYGMPAFRQQRLLVSYAAFKDHCSFFVMSTKVLDAYADDLAPFISGRGTLRFTVEKPLPVALVKKLVKARLAENASAPRSPRAESRGTS